MGEYRILTYDTGSAAGKLLTDALRGRMIRSEGSTYRLKPEDRIVRWGLYGRGNGLPTHVNQPEGIEICTSKRHSFSRFAACNVPHPQLTNNREVAFGWIQAGGKAYARYEDNGCKGSGIRVCHTRTELDATRPLYWTKGFHIDREFRIYTAFGKVIGSREKIAPQHPTSEMDLNPEIRASDDWIYSTQTTIPSLARVAAVAATKAIRLDFAGVDLATNDAGDVCVFECNSAPWLSEYLATKLANTIRENCPL